MATTREALEAAIADQPDDASGYLAYGDLLQLAGDPRGELIALAHAGETDPTFARRIVKLFARHPELRAGVDKRLEVRWRYGFVRTARLDRLPQPIVALQQLVGSEAGRFVRELEIGPLTSGLDYRPIIAALGALRIPALRRLVIGDFFSPDQGLVRDAVLGEVAAIGRVAPQLTDLVLQGATVELTGLVLPQLVRLELRGGAANAEQLAAAFPRLDELVVWRAPDAAVLGGVLPHLTRLGVRFAADDALCEALARSEIRDRLTAIDLRGGTISDAGAAHLVGLPVRVDDNLLGAKGCKRLAIARATQRTDRGSRHPDARPRLSMQLSILQTAAGAAGDERIADRIAALREMAALAHHARAWSEEAKARYLLAVAVHANGRVAEARAQLERALELQRDRRAIKAIKELLATVAMELGDEAKGTQLAKAVLAKSGRAGDRARALVTLAGNASGRGQHAEARGLFDQALDLAREAKDERHVTHILHMLAVCDQMLGRFPQARRGYELARTRMLGDQFERERAKLLLNFGGLLWQLGDWAEAERMYRESGEASHRIGDRRNDAHVLFGLGQIHLWRGDYAQAIPECEAALALFRDIGFRDGARKALNLVADAYLQFGDNARAHAAAEQALAISRELGDPGEQALAMKNLGDVALNRWELEAGERWCRDALAIYRTTKALMPQAGCNLAIGGARLAAGDLAAAGKLFASAQAAYTRLGVDHGWPASQRALLELCRGDRAAAEREIKEALALAERAGDPGQIRRNLAVLAAATGSRDVLADATARFAAAQAPVGAELLAVCRAYVERPTRRTGAVPTSFEARLLYERLWKE